MDPENFKIKYCLNLNAQYVPKLNETFVIKCLPDEDDQLERKGFRFLTNIKSDKPDPDPVKEQQKQDEIFKDEVKRRVLRKAEKNKAAFASGRYEDVDFHNLHLGQRLGIFCDCGHHEDGLESCPYLKNMRTVRYESNDESSGGEEEEEAPEMAGKDKP